MKKRLLVVVLVIVFSLLAGCGDSVKTWRVTRGTGLYDRASVDAEQIDFLDAGTRVKDIYEENSLSRCYVDEGIESCFVIVVETGQRGYVIKRLLD